MLYASCVLFLILTTGLKACVIIICALYMREWILRSGKGKMWVLNPNLYDWSPHIVSPPHCLSHRWRNSLLPVPEGRKVGKGWKSSKAGEDEAKAPVSHLNQAIMFYFNFPQTYSSVTLGWKKKRKKKAQLVLEKCQVLHFSGRVQNNQNVEHPQTDANLYRSLFQRRITEIWKEQLMLPAQLIFLEYKCCASKVWFTQRRKHNCPLLTHGMLYAFSFPHIIALAPHFLPIKWGTDVTLTAKVRTSGGEVGCPVGVPGEQDSNWVPSFFTTLLAGAPRSLCKLWSPGKDKTIRDPTRIGVGGGKLGEGEEGPWWDPGRGVVVTKAVVGSSWRLCYSFHQGHGNEQDAQAPSRR